MTQYVIDAFTDRLFSGNPAAVCVLESWPEDGLMQSIALENNLSETAFAVAEGEGYRLRWFTPGGEIDLCGHATLATASVIHSFYRPDMPCIEFYTMSGTLKVSFTGDMAEMDFPAYELRPVPVTAEMEDAIGARVLEAYMGRDLLCVLENEELVRNAAPDMDKVCALDGLLLHISAPGSEHDCVSRSFAPKLKVIEDPVCGSGHCHIVPYWAKKLGRQNIIAYQASRRGGTLYCRMAAGRVFLAGKTVLYSEAELRI